MEFVGLALFIVAVVILVLSTGESSRRWGENP